MHSGNLWGEKIHMDSFLFLICCGVFHLQRKIELLEQKLLEEQHERKLVQEKAEEVKQKKRQNCKHSQKIDL